MQNGMVSQDQTNAFEHFDDRDGSGVRSGWKMVLVQADHLTNDHLPHASVNNRTNSATIGVDNSNMLSAPTNVEKDTNSELKSCSTSLSPSTTSFFNSYETNAKIDKTLKLDKGSQFRHVFRFTKKEEPKIRKKLNTQFIVLETRKDGVKFTNTKLKKLGDKYQQILEEYKSCQKQLVVEIAATFSEVFESLAALISELDVLLSFVDLASSCPTPYTRPEITSPDEGDIILEEVAISRVSNPKSREHLPTRIDMKEAGVEFTFG
ncbi:hypothetical protein RYX36_035126 [Vicia faba]